MLGPCIAVFVTLAALLHGALAKPSINSIIPSSGTLAGGTRLSIYGTEFGDMYTTPAVVYVGPFHCEIVEHLSSSEVLTCLTSPGEAGTYTVAVVVGGSDSVSYWGYSYRADLTPSIRAVTPGAGPPGTNVAIYGGGAYYLDDICVESKWGETSCVGSILLGDYLCRQDPGDPNAGISFMGSSRYGRDESYLYRLGCQIPSPDSSDTQPALGVAGNVNATVHFESSLRGGTPISYLQSYQYDVAGNPYQFQMHAEVSSVSPATGSNAGGTLLKITGRGFPDLSLGLPQTIDISVSGVPCTIVNSTFDTAFCVTGPKPETAPPEDIPIGGLYPGMRGLEYEFYDMTPNSLPGYSQLWKLNKTILINETGTDSFRMVVTGSMHYGHYDRSYYCSRMRLFFKAPRTANYSFYIATDDYGQLNGTWLENGAEVKEVLTGLNTWTYVDDWFRYPTQRSRTLQLAAGQRMLMEAAGCNGPSIGMLQVGFRMSVPKAQTNSIPEVQTISVTPTTAPRIVLIKYLYGAGVNTTAWTATITSLVDAKLKDPRLGLEIAFNNGTGRIVVPLNKTGAELDDIVESQLGESFANDGMFGLQREREYGKLTLTFGIYASNAPAELSWMRLVTLPAPNTSATVSASSFCRLNLTMSEMWSPPPIMLDDWKTLAGVSTSSLYDATSGLALVVRTTRALPAMTPRGNFTLGRMDGVREPFSLPYSTNSSTMYYTMASLTDTWPASVTINDIWREGLYFGRVWNVTFSIDDNNVPDLYALPGDDAPVGVVLGMEVRPANPPVTGFFRLAFGRDCASSVRIDVTDSETAWKRKLATLPGMAPPRSVKIEGRGLTGYRYTITFDPVATPGDQPQLLVSDVSGLRGVSPTASVSTLMDGSTDAFWGPASAEFLEVAVAEPGAIGVTVNDVPSACAYPSGTCRFRYADDKTPTITSVSPSVLSFETQSSLPLTITGTKFDEGSEVEVRVGATVCNVTSVTATQIVCMVPDTAPAGVRLVTVNVHNLGFAANPQNVTLKTLFVTGVSPAPAVVSATGWTVLNFTGKGFDSVNCGNNRLSIGSVLCGTGACGPNFVTVLFPGNGGTAVAAAKVVAQVFENSTVIDTSEPDTPTVQISLTGPAVTAVSPTTMPGAGGVVSATLTGVPGTAVVEAVLVPAVGIPPTNYSELAAANKAQVPCGDVTATSTGFTCRSPGLPNGRYHLVAVLASELIILSRATILFDFVITSVTPNIGSIGGGTRVTITGYGFATEDPSLNAAFIMVPTSTTFLNGIVPCISRSVNSTHLVCETQAHLAADVDIDDPMARNVKPVATQPRPVELVICGPTYNTSFLREYCWSLDETPRARCGASGNGTSCMFGYNTVSTPSLTSVSPSFGAGGTTITITGSYLQDVTEVHLLTDGEMHAMATNVLATASAVNCTLPHLPPGSYKLLLQKANGEKSVDSDGPVAFTYVPIIIGLSGNIGSLAGGLPLTLRVDGAGVVPDNTTANVVTIGGLPCPVLSAPSPTELVCRAPSINGYVLAEYWNLGAVTYSMPDIATFTQPMVARYERSVGFKYDWASPIPGVIQTDFWAARYTFYYQIGKTESVALYLTSDDESRLYVDDELLGGGRRTSVRTTLTAGIHKFVITFVEYGGVAGMDFKIAYVQPDGTLGGSAPLEWQKVTPVAPGVMLPVDLTVNGVPAEARCPETNVVLQLPYQQSLPFEPSDLTLPNDTCSYVYTTYRTPALTSVPGIAPNGIQAPNFQAAGATMSIFGTFLTDPTRRPELQLNVTVMDQVCEIQTVTSFTYNTTTTSGQGVANSTLLTTRITCVVPPLPVGVWPVTVLVSGVGVARPTDSVSTELPTVTYTININDVVVPPAPTPSTSCLLSVFGGGTVTIAGYGFVKGVEDPVLDRNMTAQWDSSNPCGVSSFSRNSVTCGALWAGRLQIIPVASDGFTATFRLSRFSVTTLSAISSTDNAVVVFKPVIYYYNSSSVVGKSTSSQLTMCTGRTPVLSQVTPETVQPNVGNTNITLTWTLSAVGNSLVNPGNATNATIEFEVGPTLLPCTKIVRKDFSISATSYSENVACQMPSYMPAANYTLWLCVQPFGCGQLPAYTVPLTVSGINATRGSTAGGIVVTITGNGFDRNKTLVSARFGDSNCTITSSTATSVVCVTGPLEAKPASAVTFPLSITPTVGAAEATYPAFTFTFDPALEATVSTVLPRRGSTEGGTPITISGTDFQTNVVTQVFVGETPCTSVKVIDSTTITAVTGNPPKTVLRRPLPVSVFQEGRGLARSTASYQYIDLWSRNTTWGGGPLPGFEDSVVIPEGITVLLDMSPPKLFIIVLEGNLIFDDEMDYLNLQAHYIIVKGGNFTIGSAAKPFPGKANITMHGAPNSRELPMYGAKSLAVRQGVVSFFGKPKTPIYTTLNSTVDVDDTTITINGAVNWEIGDRIVIASSSFYAREVDEATITGIDDSSVPGCTVLTLDTPLKYTHLGEIHTHEGVEMSLDMRAEVAVLTRNIVVQGDWTSARNMYGVQVMVNSPRNMPRALVRFDNIEITQSGQAFRLGRYSMHWHMHGDVAFQSWVRGCSIHHTYNRAITVHGTHRAVIQNTLAYHVMGHTFFLEDGIEWGNLIEGNIGIFTKLSDALLNTDTTPATFWVTNPNNTIRNNRAAGSSGYGYWYRLLDNPEGPSFTYSVCPKFTPLMEFNNNTAHSNMFYGLRIHPEYYPRNFPCNGFNYGTFEQVPAVFNGLVAYKNGMKGAVGTQVGLVQLTNIVTGDNGGGPKQHLINGKDHGGNLELSWVVDDRNRYNTDITNMAGVVNATIFARTTTGARGSAGVWPSCRRIAGVITQSPVLGDSRHSALMSIINTTFVDFAGASQCTSFSALEACGKCKTFQGGSTTFTSGLSFVQSDAAAKPLLSNWSWGHQGVYQDMDGTLINPDTLVAVVQLPADSSWTYGPNTTWHSAVDSELFDPAECVYVRNVSTANNGAYCSPALTFRRIMLNNIAPDSIDTRDLNLVSLDTNRTSVVHFTKYNENGYQFTVPVGRDYWVHWDLPFRVDPDVYRLHKMDLMNSTSFTYISTKYVQKKNHFKVNGIKVSSNATDPPPPLPTTPHGASSYNTTFVPNSWWWGNRTYNDTKFTTFVAGRFDASIYIGAYTCPDEGCSDVPDIVIDVRNGTLYWSNISTWNTSKDNQLRKPIAGDNVLIPQGWNLVIDESPPTLLNLTIQGNVSFDPTKSITLNLTNILIMGKGVLRAGSPNEPHKGNVTIYHYASRDTPDFAVDNSLVLGSKFLAAIQGGTIELYGQPVNKTWVKLGAPASPNDTTITLSDPGHGWSVGNQIIITSTTFNLWQSEIRTIAAIRNNGTVLVLNESLSHPHGATIKSYPNGPTVDMRAEVGLLSSNILITSADGPSTYSFGGEKFGVRVVVSGKSTGRFDRIAMTYCGQGGLKLRACLLYDRMGRLDPAENSTATRPNPSGLTNSALVYGMYGNVHINGTADIDEGVEVSHNVMYEAFDTHSVHVETSNNIIKGNLVLGTIKNMVGDSNFNINVSSTFSLVSANNYVTDNVAAGSERYGFTYFGLPCTPDYGRGSFTNNTVHSSLAGLWLRASDEAKAVGCTQLQNFTAYMNWDYGIVSTRGIPTDVVLVDVNILDTKHAGVHLMVSGAFADQAAVKWEGGLLVGQSSPAVCSACTTLSDIGCHKKLSRQSFNREEPFTPAMGYQSAQFALGFAIGPEKKPYDMVMGYALVHGVVNITGITIADFYGPTGCGGTGVGTYALANHEGAPEAFYPHYFSDINVVSVTTGASQGMFLHTPPSPDWRNENDCGTANYNRSAALERSSGLIIDDEDLPGSFVNDGSIIRLNCAGPAHVHWRDLDGTLSGTVGTVAGIFTTPGGRIFPWDQGAPVLPGPCTYSDVTKSYQCATGSSSFLLDPTLKPNPIPPAGIWGDPQHFVLESRDKDSEDRNFGPVFFNVSGSVDVVVSAMDHGWCFAYTCQKRLSTFWTYVPTGQVVYVTFTGTPADNFRLWLPYADPDAEVIFVFNMQYVLYRRFVFLPASGRVTPQAAPPAIGDGTGHAAYHWDQDKSLFYVKMKGGQSLETRKETALLINQKFAVTIDQFYGMKDMFIKNLAFAMGIDLGRIYVAKIVPGSTGLDIGVEPKKDFPVSKIAEPDLQPARDPSDPVDPNAGSGSGSTTNSTGSTDTTDTTQAVYNDLLGAFDSYLRVVTDPNAANILGVQPIGLPTANWGSVPGAPSDAPGTTPSTPTSSPPPPPAGNPNGNGNPTGNPNTAVDPGTNPSSPGSSTPAPSSGSDGKKAPIAAIIGGVVGGCVFLAILLAIIIVAIKKRKAQQRTMPVSSPGGNAAGDGAAGGNAVAAFTGAAAQVPPVQEGEGSGMRADAGSQGGQPAFIRTPAVPGAVDSSGRGSEGGDRSVKRPAELGDDAVTAVSRRASAAMQYAPNEAARGEGWDDDNTEVVRISDRDTLPGQTPGAGPSDASPPPHPAPIPRGSGLGGGSPAEAVPPDQRAVIPGLAMTESLLNKEVAAQVMAEYEAQQAEGAGGAAAVTSVGGAAAPLTAGSVQEGGSPVPRTPAGLRSDSLRRQEL